MTLIVIERFVVRFGESRSLPLTAALTARESIVMDEPPSDTRRSRLERGFRVSAFRRRLGEAGYVEHRNVGTDYRWAEGQVDQLPAFARELVRAQVAGDESDSYLKASLRRTYRYRDLRP